MKISPFVSKVADRCHSPSDSQGSPASEDCRDEQSHLGSSSVREQDRFLPIANIGRIMKRALPANAKISKEAKDTVQECVSEFISFITSEASDKCQREKRKTINGDDLLWAMGTLGFEDYVEPLRIYLQRFRELEGDSKGMLSKAGCETMYNKEGSSHFRAQDVQVGQPTGYYNTMAYCQPRMQRQLITSQGNHPL